MSLIIEYGTSSTDWSCLLNCSRSEKVNAAIYRSRLLEQAKTNAAGHGPLQQRSRYDYAPRDEPSKPEMRNGMGQEAEAGAKDTRCALFDPVRRPIRNALNDAYLSPAGTISIKADRRNSVARGILDWLQKKDRRT